MKKSANSTQNRREFFKEAAKKALPILGVIFFSNNPVIAKVANSEPMSCSKSTCYGTCVGSCTGCKSNCYGGCYGGCRQSCSNSCRLNCQASAGGKNTGCGDCRVYCYGSCMDTCSRYCNGSCIGGTYKAY